MNPDIQLVYMVRDPVERMVSAYAQSRHLGYETRPIHEAITDMAYVAPSQYWLQLSEYLRWFEPRQIHVETLDDLDQDPHGVVGRIGSFLGVDVPAIDTNQRLNTRARQRATRGWYAPLIMFLRHRRLDGTRWQQRLHRSRLASRELRIEERTIHPTLADELRHLFTDDLRNLESFLGRPLPTWGRAGGDAASSSRR